MSKVYLYSVSDGNEVVNKNVGVIKGEVEVSVLPECTIETPRLKLSHSNVPLDTVNYFYFDEFNRYYHIDPAGTGLLNNEVVQLTGKIDPLKSFSGSIYGLNCVVSRNEFEYNGDIVDDEVTPRITRQLTKKIIGNVGKLCNIALTVAGGEDTE